MAGSPEARERNRRWRAGHPDQSKAWRDANPGATAGIILGYQARNPEKRRAHNAVSNALRDGRLLRPAMCSACGDMPAPNARGASRIEAHHQDYARPLDVIWLCRPCHKRQHREDT